MGADDTGIQGYASLGADINKTKTEVTPETKEGVVSDKLPELNLEMEDSEIVKLTNRWEKIWKESPKKVEWEKQCEENEKYWLGLQFDGPKLDKTRPQVDNVIFEAFETYLPQVTRRNPDPLVTLDATIESTPEYEKYIEKLKKRLSDLADKNKLRLKLKKAARHWGIYLIGVAKVGWDLDKDLPIVRIVRPHKMILDPDAIIDEDGYNGNRLGEYRRMEASTILSVIADEPNYAKSKEKIDELITKDGELNTSTEISFIEWWTPEYMCWKLGQEILLKKKNPHWNYDRVENKTAVDTYGNESIVPEEVKGINHFPVPEMPYRFLTVFNLGDQPMDKTSLIGQNLANQDLINKRNKQIDKNADRMNGGMVVSLEKTGLTKDQAKGVSDALRKGGVVVIPTGTPREAIDTYSPNALPSDVYMQLTDTRARLRDIFGVKGSSAAGLETEDTVRGKIMNKTLDTDRIGGGVSEYLEQFADDIYNWFVQLLYVYDPGFQFINGGTPPKVNISVKEGSLLPKDSTSIANQALELAGMNRISNIDLYKRLEYPNAEELAANVWLEANAPQLLFKDNPLVQEAIAQAQAAQAQKQQEEMQNKEVEQSVNLAKEKIKASNKGVGNKSMLKEVPATPKNL